MGLIQRRSQSYWPTLPSGLAWDCPKPNGEERAGKFWMNCRFVLSFPFVFFKKKHFTRNQLFLTKLSQEGFLDIIRYFVVCKCLYSATKALDGHVGTPDLCQTSWPNPSIPDELLVMVSPAWYGWSGLLTNAWFIQPKYIAASQLACWQPSALTTSQRKKFKMLISPNVWIMTNCGTRHELSSYLKALKGVAHTSTSQKAALSFDASANFSAHPHVGNFLLIFKPCTASFCCHSL